MRRGPQTRSTPIVDAARHAPFTNQEYQSNLSTRTEYGRRNNVDLWNVESDGRSAPHAIDYMLPFAAADDPWQGKQLHRGDPGEMTGVYAAWRGLDDSK